MNSLLQEVKLILLLVMVKIKTKKGISKSFSKIIKVEEYKNCLDGQKYQKECDNEILRSVNPEM